MPAGAVGKMRHGAATDKGAPKKPSIPSAKSIKATSKTKGK